MSDAELVEQVARAIHHSASKGDEWYRVPTVVREQHFVPMALAALGAVQAAGAKILFQPAPEPFADPLTGGYDGYRPGCHTCGWRGDVKPGVVAGKDIARSLADDHVCDPARIDREAWRLSAEYGMSDGATVDWLDPAIRPET